MRATATLVVAIAAASLVPPSAASWRPVGQLDTARGAHTASALPDGRVLIAGGNTGALRATRDADVYDPAFDPLSRPVRRLSARAVSPRSVRLRFDPPSPWQRAGAMRTARGRHTATLLADGRVLVAGGAGSNGTPLASAEIYDPRRDRWSEAQPLATARASHDATALPDGRVLVTGGVGADGAALASAELFDPAAGRWSAVAPMAVPRANHTATTGPDGRVLVAGGDSERVPGRNPEFIPTRASEVFDPASGIWTSPACGDPAPETPSPCMHVARSLHTATQLQNGMLIVAGGIDANDNTAEAPRRSTELYDPARGVWTTAAPMGAARAEHAAAALPGGGVLATGGRSPSPASAELFRGNAWAFAPSLDVARRAHTATALTGTRCRPHCGEVLVVGGRTDPVDSPATNFVADPVVFRAGGAPSARRGAPAERYVVKQSRAPIRGARAFARAESLCRRSCRFAAARRGGVEVTVRRLRPGTTYYYAVQAVDGRRRGGISNVARVRTGR